MRSGAFGSSLPVRGDAKIIAVGSFFRDTTIDELPQFWNVMRGDMSVVGPRPEVPDYVELFRGRYRNIFTIRPGITDLASIRFWNEEAIFAESQNPLKIYKSAPLPARLDLADRYLHERSVFQDLAIILKTVIITLRPPASACSQVTCNDSDSINLKS